MGKRHFEASVVLPTLGYAVLLGIKLERVCVGMRMGWGGNPDFEKDRDMLDTAIRELFEELHILARHEDLIRAGEITCENPDFICTLHIFTVDIAKCAGTPHIEPDQCDMAEPKWFSIWGLPDTIPPGDKYWLPKVLDGKKVRGTVKYGPKQQTLLEEPVIEEVQEFLPFKPYPKMPAA